MSTDENFVVAGAPFTNVLQSDGSTRYTDNGSDKNLPMGSKHIQVWITQHN